MARGSVPTSSTKWRVLPGKGINYPRPGRPRTGPGSNDEIRKEEGEIIDDLPADVAGGYLEHGDIEPYSGAVSVPSAPEPEAPVVADPPIA